jgi:hypothetical protein
MSAFQHLREAIRESSYKSGAWGLRGERAITDIESQLGVQFPDSVRDFIREFGNVNLSPFQVVIAGNETGTYSCVTESYALRKWHPSIPDNYVKIMGYAGVVYCVVTSGSRTGRVISWDEHYPPVEGSILKEFSSFEGFIEWLIAESRSIALDNRFQF